MKKRILLADDEPHVLQGLRRILHPLRGEWDIAFAENGREVLEQLAQAFFDVVITDIMMPEMEGLETIRELRCRFPAVKIVAISGGGRMGSLQFLDVARKLGAHRTLSKPFTPHQLIETIREMLQSNGKAPERPCKRMGNGHGHLAD